MKYSPIDLNVREKLNAEGKPYPLEFGSVAGDMVLRNAAKGNVLVSYVGGLVEKDDGASYQHVFTGHRCGAVVIPFDRSNRKIALTAINRPVVPPHKASDYMSAWDQCIERKDSAFSNFKQALFPMLGMDTIQFPQGYGEAGETPDENARRVLRTQGGFDAPLKLEKLNGYVVIDPGNRVSPTWFYLAEVDPAARLVDPSLPRIHWVDEIGYFNACAMKDVISDFVRSGYSLLKENRYW